MSHYVHTLTEIETECGVTLDTVAAELPRVAIRDNGAVWISADLPPAVAGSVARAAVGGPVRFSHLSLGATIAVYYPA
ncbi:hypothetical protein [Gordonia phage GTE5]|uniref:Uncharacterized protein n=2 Tax=Gruunavirus TaxID=2948731 RepID=A0A386K9U6_9CAUD|nr:hypothetical protein GoPhGTE5p69 [Gordonia phage GTE5]YP_010098785.1 hypothetical protein KNU13_gp85 [Gordonia phage Turuncu]AET09818.1 hypothetical protein [Gordonia phage GTE5]AYD82171.1 hypothetical protein SEA_TURUNCU_85 [Gordonia phage Turuncu]